MKLNSKKYVRISIVTIIFMTTLILNNIFITINANALNNNVNNEMDIEEPIISSSSTYERQDVDGVQPVGMISLVSINRLADGEFIIENNTQTNGGILAKELLDNKIKYEYQGFELLEVLDNATIDSRNSLNEGFIDIRINNTVIYDYWENHTRSVISYRSEFSQHEIYSSLHQMTINGSEIDTDEVEIYEGGYIYNYSSYQEANENGTLEVSFITDFNLTIREWKMQQYKVADPQLLKTNLPNVTNNYVAYYNYTFSPGPVDISDSNRPYLLDFSATYKIDLPDKNYLNNISMTRYQNISEASAHSAYTLNDDNSIVISVDCKPTSNVLTYSINSAAEFTIEFKNVHNNFWARDYLFDKSDVRNREYEISVTEGPDDLLVGYFNFNESNIPYDDVYSVKSAFDRVSVNFDNATKIGGGVGEGIAIFHHETIANNYYLIKGEIDIITVKYRADNILSLVVLDTTQLPLAGIGLKIHYENVTYGTMMSNDLVNALPMKYTDSRGGVIVSDVPKGLYTISIYQNGRFMENVTVESSDQINYIYSSIPQFPTWILIFTAINIAFIIGGIYYHNKNKR